MEREKRKSEVAVVGAAFMDLQVFTVNRTLLDVPSFPAQKMLWSVGGDAINEATVLTRLGHETRLVSCIGRDLVGGMVLEHCRKNGIDVSCLREDPEKNTSINIGLIGEDAERTFITNRSGSIWTIGPEDMDVNGIDGVKVLSFASIFNTPLLTEDFMIPLFEKARAQGTVICADVVSPKNGETLESIRGALRYVDYFFPNLEEARRLTGKEDWDEIADTFLEIGVGTVVLKTGKAGCLLKSWQERHQVSAYPSAKCIDTTGAGDNFAAGFISALLEGCSPRECAVFANCVASIAVEAIGATEGLRSRAQADERRRAYGN